MKKLSLIFFIVLSLQLSVFAQTKAKNQENPLPSASSIQTPDSNLKKIDTKIQFYQDQQKQNDEIIQKLQHELELRKELAQRLTGALSAATEIKKILSPLPPPEKRIKSNSF